MRVRTMTKSEGMRYNISDYPNFAVTGSIRGMKEKYYSKKAMLVKCGGFIYNVPSQIYYQAH